MNTDLMFSSATPEHFTPSWILDLVERVAPIGLDPCAHPKAETTKRARCLVTQHAVSPSYVAKTGKTQIVTDGLKVAWQPLLDAQRTFPSEELVVFENTPYGRELAAWAAKSASEKSCPIVALVPARVATGWWNALDPLAWCALRGRLKFWHLPHDWQSNNAVSWDNEILKCKLCGLETKEPEEQLNCPAAEPVEAANSAPFPSAVCLLHAPQLVERFVKVFSPHGPVYKRAR